MRIRTSFGADVIKADNLEPLGQSGSWVGNQPPGPADVAVWDLTVATAVPQDVLLGTDASWADIRIVDPAGAITIGAGDTLTLGASGIDTSLGVQPLTLAGD